MDFILTKRRTNKLKKIQQKNRTNWGKILIFPQFIESFVLEGKILLPSEQNSSMHQTIHKNLPTKLSSLLKTKNPILKIVIFQLTNLTLIYHFKRTFLPNKNLVKKVIYLTCSKVILKLDKWN